jgi:hypothetical protein
MLGIEPNTQSKFGVEIAIMEHTGWSWAELRQTPAAVIDEMIVRIEAKSYWLKKKQALDNAAWKIK